MMYPTKSKTKAVGILVVFALLVLSRGLPVSASTSSASTCSDSLLSQGEQTATASINPTIANDTAAPTLAMYAESYNARYNSIFYRFTWNSGCSVALENVSVDYTLKAPNGTVYTLGITVNPSLATVLNVDLYPNVNHGTVENGSYWAGYEYYNSSGIEQNGADWSIPTIEGPGGDSSLCESDSYSDECEYSFWVGQTAAEGGGPSGYIAQTGTDSYCTFACTSGYFGYDIWYEFAGAGSYNACDTASAGDSVTAYVSETSNDYYAHIYDNTDYQACFSWSPSNFNMGESYYAQFMGEVPGSYALPDFSTISVSSGYYYDRTSNYHTIGNSWPYLDVINKVTSYQSCNSQSHEWNVCPGSVSSGSFTEIWLTSLGYY
jgi:hypothetical protein